MTGSVAAALAELFGIELGRRPVQQPQPGADHTTGGAR